MANYSYIVHSVDTMAGIAVKVDNELYLVVDVDLHLHVVALQCSTCMSLS